MYKVSVLTPVYNVEKYLVQCLESLLRQSLLDIELICINDGSTDRSLQILQEYAKKDPRIKVIDKENTGYGNSMNVGMQLARGEYIGIVESDDFAEFDMFERLYMLAIKNNADVVKSNYYMYQEKFKEKNDIVNVLNGLEYENVFSPMDNLKVFSTTPSIWSGIYRRAFLKDNHIFFNETPGASYQDTSFIFKVWACAKKVFLIKEAFLHYRVDNVNSSVQSLAKVFCVCDEYEEIDRFLRKNSALDINFKYLVEALKYRTYQWNYNRLSDQYKYEFLVRAAKEFGEAQERGNLKKEYWVDQEWINVHNLIGNTKQFFYEKVLLQQKNKMYLRSFLQILAMENKIIIYGAGIIGRRVAEYLKNKKYKNLSFAVSSLDGNPQVIFEIPVYCIKNLHSCKEHSIVLVSTREQDQIEIFDSLSQAGFSKVILIDSQLLQLLNI